MFEAGIVILLLSASTAAAARAKFSWWGVALIIGVLEILGVVLLGLPGAAFLEAVWPVMERAGRAPITGDAAWPAAIVMSLAWPLALVPACALARSKGDGARRGLAVFLILAVVCAVMAVLVHLMAADSPKV